MYSYILNTMGDGERNILKLPKCKFASNVASCLSSPSDKPRKRT
jgi:hypothetical protein